MRDAKNDTATLAADDKVDLIKAKLSCLKRHGHYEDHASRDLSGLTQTLSLDVPRDEIVRPIGGRAPKSNLEVMLRKEQFLSRRRSCERIAEGLVRWSRAA
jgi:hypothetical protein